MEGKKLSADEALRILAGSEEAGTLLGATVGTSEGVGSRPASSAACAPRSPAGRAWTGSGTASFGAPETLTPHSPLDTGRTLSGRRCWSRGCGGIPEPYEGPDSEWRIGIMAPWVIYWGSGL